ncbi:MAG: 2-amino-4-hydroxy-6-hydroxymethyldihydropteridine diphosphokinase [Candidatus Hydrogenedentes bacterium]|nr:2-amino-4-hydroxy-6-hydroxymethyldihydropteridine diphosphokinase [Candidatus Hydrogenedentota bacterium]
MRQAERVFLSLGSNLGDRIAHLAEGLKRLGKTPRVTVVNASHTYETEPAGIKNQPAFYNMVAEIETDLEPLELLNVAKKIELELGRKPTERWGPRTIDIDIVLWGNRVSETGRLSLPHKEFRGRDFVLAPFAEIAPEVVDPVTRRTIRDLAAQPRLEGQCICCVLNRSAWSPAGTGTD